jgi:putative spermidine/putrescine transport system permease protein
MPAPLEDRLWPLLGRLLTGLTLCFLLLPLLIVVVMSFTSGNLLAFPMPGLSWRWYETVLSTPAWRDAARNSLIVGTAATALALVLGVPAAIALAGSRLRLKGLIVAVILSPMIVPIVVTAVAVYFFFVEVGLVGTYAGLVLAHAVLGVPFVVVTVTATLEGFDPMLMRAAAGLGAPPLTAFRRVMLPLIFPGVATGALFAFSTSFDEIVVALFLAAPDQRTLPRQIFSGVREYVSPAIAAVATLLILLAALLLLAAELLRRRSERLRGVSRTASATRPGGAR